MDNTPLRESGSEGETTDLIEFSGKAWYDEVTKQKGINIWGTFMMGRFGRF